MNMISEPQSRLPQILQLALVAAILFGLTTFLQIRGGAYKSEFGGHPDEAAHYVTGLMIRDYVAAGFPGHPKKYADNYYAHYPKVALGNWPPMFYLMQTGWTLLFTPERTSMFIFMAVFTTGVGLLLFHLVRQRLGFSAGLITGLLFVMTPLTQRHTSMLMTEVPITLFTLLALYFLAKFFETKRTRDSVLFGVFASIAILTKGSGMFLALVPVLTIVITRNFQIMRRLNFWYPAVIVAILCGPWTFAFRNIARAGWMEENPSMNFTSQALQFYPGNLVWSVGIALAALAIAGITSELKLARKGAGVRAVVFASAIVSLLFFHSIMPVGLEDRHLLPVLPLVIYFAIFGAHFFGVALSRKFRASEATVIMAAVAIFLLVTFKIPVKGYSGFGKPAEMLLREAPDTKTKFLVSSDAQGEGMFIAEVAMREKRPGHVVQRTSKALASSTWSGSGYSAKFENEAAVIKYLKEQEFQYVVVDSSMPPYQWREHHKLLSRTVEQFPNEFSLLENFSVQRKGVWTNALAIYRLDIPE
ncbi:MAG: glycosyltransferase family 39 protein [Verrucomicrobia bacterium]|nr:glycosyltransferase family 39 protein [Verrucomicrobiota bacterium]